VSTILLQESEKCVAALHVSNEKAGVSVEWNANPAIKFDI
jgi:hypothetical protein